MTSNSTNTRGKRRVIAFRLLAVLAAVSVFAAAETVCRVAGWGLPADHEDEFVGFSATRPLFVPNQDGSRYVIPPARRPFFAEESFPARKGSGTFRIFVLGGSTVQGRPYSIETSFTTWLRLSLETAQPDRKWEVINCGGVSYATYRLVPILRECLAHAPDLIVICTGHNEFLEDRTYASIKDRPAWERRLRESAARLRLYQVSRSAWNRVRSFDRREPPIDGDAAPDSGFETASRRATMPAEVDALLDYRDGLAAYRRDTVWQDRVIAHFRYNLDRMLRMTADAGVPVLMVLPPSNLRDCPPFKSQHRDGMTAEALAEWNRLVDEGQALFRESPARAIEYLERAVKLDPAHALTHFDLGKCHESLAQRAPAARAFRLARDLDICPLRILTVMESILEEAARKSGTRLIDARRILEPHCSWQIIGSEVLVDHVHPSITAHQLIARGLARAMADEGYLDPSATFGIDWGDDWEAAERTAFERHMSSLDPIYFLHGQRRLRNLQAWTQGRADGIPIEIRFPNLKAAESPDANAGSESIRE